MRSVSLKWKHKVGEEDYPVKNLFLYFKDLNYGFLTVLMDSLTWAGRIEHSWSL